MYVNEAGRVTVRYYVHSTPVSKKNYDPIFFGNLIVVFNINITCVMMANLQFLRCILTLIRMAAGVHDSRYFEQVKLHTALST
jgi:hypothetical protein